MRCDPDWITKVQACPILRGGDFKAKQGIKLNNKGELLITKGAF